jgi:hypothetical protein
VNTRSNAYRLGSHQAVTLPRFSIGQRLKVVEGTVWLTSPEDGDQILSQGDAFSPLSPATVISPFNEPARFEITGRCPEC